MNGDFVISFYDCAPVAPDGCISISGFGGSAAFLVDEDRLRQSDGLIFSVVGNLVRRMVRRVLSAGRPVFRYVVRAGRSLIHFVCVLRD